jgi:hypothetical protein
MSSNLVPRKAEKKRVKLKMAVQGPSGSGKTWGALALAKNLWPDARVCLIDTENESASLYADKFAFDTIPLGPPFTTARYVECIDAIVKGGYDVLIIDSITPQWDGEGGILRRKEALERANPNANGYALWSRFTPEHEAFKQIILQSPVHVICTMRSKQEYALQPDEKGKLKPVKLGLAPIQRDQLDYEFTLVFDVNLSHNAAVSKDRTGLFDEQGVNLADPKTADAIRGWLESGVEAPQNHSAEPDLTSDNISQPPVSSQAKTQSQPPTGKPEASPSAPQGRVGPTKRIPPTGPDKLPRLICTVKTIKEWPKNGKVNASINVKFEAALDGNYQGETWVRDHATCWHESLFEAIRASVGKECQFAIKERDAKAVHYIDIEDVIEIDGVPYDLGKPSVDIETGEIIG